MKASLLQQDVLLRDLPSQLEYFFSGRQAFASPTNMASSGLRKCYTLQNPTPRCMGSGVSCNTFLDTVVNGHHIV